MGFGGVFGTGSLAQYIVFPEKEGIVMMPGNINYEEAAACLEGPYYAAAGLLQMKLQAGQNAFVYGATGAIGSSHVQFLKHYGLQVTAVCGGEHEALVRSLGADRVIDYKSTDFTKDTERYDFVFDAVDKVSFLKCKKLLKEKGIYTSSGGFIKMFWAMITRITGGKRVLFLVPKDIKGALTFIADLVEKGKFKPVIDRKYSLAAIADAFTYVATGQKIGAVLITIDD
jgi:NADPH:quinone reductase-like Zn-dependent oxidoreductase